MPTFGFSAYLKLICLTPKPQYRSVRGRVTPKRDAYDYHRSLRRLCRRYVLNGESEAELTRSAQAIVQEPERKSALFGLRSFIKWRSANPGSIIEFKPATFQSQSKVFKIIFAPDFGIDVGGKRTAVHIWNTKSPALDRRFAHGALALFPAEYAKIANPPDELAVLSLRNGRLYPLSEASNTADATAFGLAVAMAIENLFRRAERELGLPSRRPSAPGPLPPQPAP